jgi:hypothetical protein
MSRMSGGDHIYVKPTSNIYTVLTAVAIVAVILAFVALWFSADKLFGGNLFSY